MKWGLRRTIIFFGPDGAGKSTQAHLLAQHLRSHKYRPWRSWMRGRHSLAFILSSLFTRLGYYQSVKLSTGATHKVFNPQLLPKLKRVWCFIEFISVLPWIFLKVYLPRFLGYTVVAERYVVDTVVYLAYWLGHGLLQGFLAKVLLSFIPRDSVLIHLDSEAQILSERIQNDIVTEDFLAYQQKVYPLLAKKLGAVTINTSNFSIIETFQHILEVINVE